jgi:hypothetical protein
MRLSPDQTKLVLASGLFDAAWYQSMYLDVGIIRIDPLEHYMRWGAQLLRNPGPDFSTRDYLARNPGIDPATENPLIHYLGSAEYRARTAKPAAPAPAAPRSVEIAGELTGHAGQPRILVCAHVAGKHLFGGELSLIDILDGFRQLRYHVVLAVPGIYNQAYLLELKKRCACVVKMKYEWWRNNAPPLPDTVADFAEVIAKHRIHAVHANTIMLREPLIAARAAGIRSVIHVRELITSAHRPKASSQG